MGSYYVQTKLNTFLFQEERTRVQSQSNKGKTKSKQCEMFSSWPLGPIHGLLSSSMPGQLRFSSSSQRLRLVLGSHPPRGTAVSSILGSPWQLKLHLHQQPPQTSLQGLQPFYPVPGLSYSPWPHLAFKPVTPLAVNLRCSLGHLWSTASVCWFWKNTPKRLTSVIPVSSWSALISLFPITSIDCPIKTEVSP